jgi:RimJ/RimL family protein N-acetyltransferase
VGLTRVDWVNRFANIGYWVRHSRTRLGIATTATRLIAAFGLKKLGLHRLEILIPGHNLTPIKPGGSRGKKHS